jgi:hypothetical protein
MAISSQVQGAHLTAAAFQHLCIVYAPLLVFKHANLAGHGNGQLLVKQLHNGRYGIPFILKDDSVKTSV